MVRRNYVKKLTKAPKVAKTVKIKRARVITTERTKQTKERLVKKPTKKTVKSAKQVRKIKPAKLIPAESPQPKPRGKPAIKLLRALGYVIDAQTQKIIKLLEEKGNLSENDIAEKLNIRINEARKSLYKLGGWGFANYTKKKDAEKKWWYLYFWSLDKNKLNRAYKDFLRAQLHAKEKQLLEEQQYAFICRKCNNKYTYEEALLNNFACGRCGGVVREIKNQKLIKQLSKEIEELLEKLKE